MGASSSRAGGGGGGGQRRGGGLVLNKHRPRLQRRQIQPRWCPASDTRQPPLGISVLQHDQDAVDQNASSSSDTIQRVDKRHAHEESNGTELPLPVNTEEEEEVEEEECAICLEGYSEESPKLLIQCQHHYHFHCILEWADRSHTCPICKQVAIFDGKSSPAREIVG